MAQLEEVAAAPGFWDDSAAAQAKMRELTKLREQVTVWEALSRRLKDATELVESGDEELAGRGRRIGQ